jgi:type VI secretion system protein ImpC
MAVNRFAHYFKSMMRDKIGSFTSRKECEQFLSNWVANYVTSDDNASQHTKAKYPLKEARVEVMEVPGKPGAYRAVAFLRPHFQLDELTVSLRLVASLPASARR